MLPRTSDTARLNPSVAVDALVPSILDQILDLQDRRYPSREDLCQFISVVSTDDIRDHHLYITIATETAFTFGFGDILGAWIAEVRGLDGRILLARLGEDVNHVRNTSGSINFHEFQ